MTEIHGVCTRDEGAETHFLRENNQNVDRGRVEPLIVMLNHWMNVARIIRGHWVLWS